MSEWMPLTEGQMDFWEEFMFHPNQPVSIVGHCLEFMGNLQPEALTSAISQTLSEAETLALRFRQTPDGEVEQSVDPARVPRLCEIDLRAEAQPEAAARSIMSADIDAILDLRKDPLSAQILLRLADDRWMWYCRGHHIILDGYGMALLERRVAGLYAAKVTAVSEGEPFAPLSAFINENSAYALSEECATDRAFWADYLTPYRVTLPVLQKGTEDYSLPALRATFIPDQSFKEDLAKVAYLLGLNWADCLTLLSALWLTHHDPTRKSKGPMPVWLPFMSRMGSVSANIPAMVVNILPLIVDLKPNQSLQDNLATLIKEWKRAKRHGRYRIETMAKDAGLAKGQRFYFSPLVNVMPFSPPHFEGLETRRHVLAAGPGDGFNISWTGDPLAQNLQAAFEAEPTKTTAKGFNEWHSAYASWLAQTLADFCR